ncbi:DUF885 domain-containing protein [Massilia psychrophila]|uniref:DUF885 domain-containing protein n=1 Tax=Massilia psychrophila TaxID=1603353 RepID=A0A2G8T3E4_9BURK|nr:DUF885 domain-containing protein [Massilia psychrophila]PIL40567.1 DUF885 domain-containing protein [Massilia psychrophila]GGE75070.1 hypothetical protein GCM10008020_19730 [Massilia psychrophila]
MMKTKIALAVLLAAFALAPASAAKSKKNGKPASSKSIKSAKPAKPARGKTVKPEAAPVAVDLSSVPTERKSDRWMDSTSQRFLNALWKLDPESAISSGKFDGAAGLTIPNAATRAHRITFADEWLQRFGKIDARQLSSKQRTDLTLVLNKVKADRWHLATLREHEWNPALYNIAQPIDLILTTDYAAKPQRLRTLLRRIANVPAYYLAAQASLVNPTHEHTQLAIAQAPGVMTVLADLGKAAQESILTQQEKAIFAQRIANAGSALIGYLDFLTDLDKRQQATHSARSFRLGKDLYETKFGFDIQSASTAEQTYQKALGAREELLGRMDKLADELWTKTMGSAAKPADRTRKIGMVIDKLSASHVAREDFFPEIRRQIGQLQEFVVKNNLLNLDPKRPLEVRETPLYQRGVAGASIDAPGPYRPQDRTFYNVTPLTSLTAQEAESTLREYNTWILQILNIHEAIPGHYAQLVYANKSPSLIKSLFGNGAMIEGWAVYAERMMLESGYGDNAPEMWLMYAKWNLRSVTNTILDYGVHVQGMTQPQAMDLLVRQAFQTPAEAGEKWRRVQLSSVQLTSYFSGYSEIMELREQRKQALGSKFVLKDFHEQFLGYGNAPVKVIRELMQ